MEEKTESEEIEVGSIVECNVTHVADFGAFAKCPNNQEGLIHISEIANQYVTNIHDFVEVGQTVKVKVVGKNKQGKLELSIKKADDSDKKPALFIKKKTENPDFEDKMTKFLKRSEEKQIDIRRNLKVKQGIAKKRK